LQEAKVRPKESWIKGKRINSAKKKAAIKKQVEKIIRREIKYISSFFPYNVEKFHNSSLLYFHSIFLMEDYQEYCLDERIKVSGGDYPGIRDMDPDPGDMDRKVMNLIVGLELLSAGTAFHDFKVSGTSLYSGESLKKIEKEYILDLLFGDIFYSRAVIYLLRYGDHGVFDRILTSLKELHESKLRLHRKIGDLIKADSDPSDLDSDKDLLINANRLLDASLDISFNMFCKNKGTPGKKKYSCITMKIVLLKTYDELLRYLKSLKGMPSTEKISSYLASKKNFTVKRLSDIISELDSGKSNSSLKALVDSLDI